MLGQFNTGAVGMISLLDLGQTNSECNSAMNNSTFSVASEQSSNSS